MGSKAFVITGDQRAAIANDTADFRYRALLHGLTPGESETACSNPRAETQFLVDHGTVEFMIGGATATVLAGDFVRVPPGVVFAFTNVGHDAARVLVRTTSPQVITRALSVTGPFAA